MRFVDFKSGFFPPALTAVLKDFSKDEKGTTAIEYSLIVFLIGVAIVGALMSMGSTIGDDLLVPIANVMTDAVSGE